MSKTYSQDISSTADKLNEWKVVNYGMPSSSLTISQSDFAREKYVDVSGAEYHNIPESET